MKRKNIILLSTMLVSSLGAFAQNEATSATSSTTSSSGASTASSSGANFSQKDLERADSIWKDVDLEGVTVVASKPLVKMETDKMTYNVEQDADAKASTVLDMLRKVPMVTVDGQDNITVNGSSSFKVYVDGKPNPMFSSNPSQIFKAMPATMVKNIEVITNPGAKYDAEGTGGVLNIILNHQAAGGMGGDSMNGYNGNVSISGGNTSQRIGAFISGQQGKLTYSANGMYNYSRMAGTTIDLLRTQQDGSTMHYQQRSTMKQPFAMGNISLSYELDSLSNISATAGLTSFSQKMNGNPTTEMYGGIYGKGFGYGNETRQKLGMNAFNGSIDYQRYFSSDRSSYMILSYLFSSSPHQQDDYTYYNKESEEITAIKLNDLLSKSKTRGTEHTLQADFTEKLSATQQLNFGAKYIARINKSDSKYYDIAADKSETFNPDNSVDYKNTQNILAAYAEWKGNFGNWSTKAGARYEHTWEKVDFKEGNGEDFKKDYGNLVPSASLSYSITPGMNIGMNYSMRISRPGITYLNPYVDRSNPTSISYGNTDLDVEKSHQLNLVYNYYQQKFMLSVTAGYSFCDNQIAQYSFIDDKNLLNQTYGNVQKDKRALLSIFANWLVFPKTRLMLNQSVCYADMRSQQLGMKNNGWNSSTLLNLQQTLPWELQWTAGGMVQTKSYTLQGYQNGMSFFYTTLSKSLLKDKLNLSLMFLTPLSDKLEVKSKTVGSDYVQNMTVKVPLRQISLTLTWKFGNTKKQFQQRKSNINNDFKEEQQGLQMGSMTGSGEQ